MELTVEVKIDDVWVGMELAAESIFVAVSADPPCQER